MNSFWWLSTILWVKQQIPLSVAAHHPLGHSETRKSVATNCSFWYVFPMVLNVECAFWPKIQLLTRIVLLPFFRCNLIYGNICFIWWLKVSWGCLRMTKLSNFQFFNIRFWPSKLASWDFLKAGNFFCKCAFTSSSVGWLWALWSILCFGWRDSCGGWKVSSQGQEMKLGNALGFVHHLS